MPKPKSAPKPNSNGGKSSNFIGYIYLSNFLHIFHTPIMFKFIKFRPNLDDVYVFLKPMYGACAYTHVYILTVYYV